jgi:chromosome segregation protein
VFLKSITLRGFKSFADKTVLDFEPGITVVVGPNGSGKSNIVDALTWVLGTHSAKTLRGGCMADVIYAGAPGRPPLGRAAVEITIDNSAGTLPIEFAEVTICRAMFATGETSYRINDVECRALDVQELLSDTGLGRATHTIVGQGQLDAILNARPEERRLFVEEAAGILKHRRRKERALRKLAQMTNHVERLTDVLRELRRSLRPLERQAEAAAKAAELRARLREVRLERALREFAAAAAAVESDETARASSQRRLQQLSGRLAEQREREHALEAHLGDLAPAARSAAETHFRLANLAERYRGLAARIVERRRGLVAAVSEPVAGRDPAQLRVHARAERAALEQAETEHTAALARLEIAREAHREVERARRAYQQAAAAEARRHAEDLQRRLRWEAEVAALQGQLAQAAREEGRLASQAGGLCARREELLADLEEVRAEERRLTERAGPLAERLETARRLVQRCRLTADEASRRERELERRRASAQARADTLRAAAQDAGEGAACILKAAQAGELDGILGRLADHVSVPEGEAAAVSSALGALEDALVVTGRDAARVAISLVRSRQSARALLLVAQDEGDASPPEGPDLAKAGARPLIDLLNAQAPVLGGLRRALAGIYLVEDFATACEFAARHPDLVFVSLDGAIAGARGYAGGAVPPRAPLLAASAAAEAARQAAHAASELLVVHRQVEDAHQALAAARCELDAATAATVESDGLATATAERLRRLGKELAHTESQFARLRAQQGDVERETEARRRRLEALEQRETGAPTAEAQVFVEERESGDLEAERIQDAVSDAREREVQARIAASGAEQRAALLRRRIEDTEREADTVERQLAEFHARRQARLVVAARCDKLAALVEIALRRALASQALAAEERDTLDERRAEAQRSLGALRARLREGDHELAALIEQRHREDLVSQQLRHRLDVARARLSDDLGLDPGAALDGADPAVWEADPLRDETLARDEERLSRKLALLGDVNPLAIEECESLRERHRFLSDQLEDCRTSKRDLMEVVEAVDGRIREVFAAAFADVAAQFERLFPRLFPGGDGRLRLTDPDDLLEAGVEVEVRLPGKRVRRLSLLSGGERSLCALAVLFAIFAARPSPFYVLDEVEAALDDVNLQRFLDVVRDFNASQLLVVTHQKRTMEVADVLYGVTMQAGGVSKVVSQRVADLVPTPTRASA